MTYPNMKPELTEVNKHDFCLEALERKTDLERSYLELGAMLYRIKEERLFEAGWESWDEYAMEFRMSQAAISRMLRIYEVFQLRFKLAPKLLASAGGWTVLGDLLPSIKEDTTRERVLELIDLAGLQTRVHLQQTLKEIKRGGVPCKHKNTHELHLMVCEDCGERWSIAGSGGHRHEH